MALSCYVANYLPGSFKGVPFQVEVADSEHGRRGAEGEFPFGEETAYVDMGRKIRRYHIKGRMQENTHVLDTAALIAAVETPGPGILVHPTRGILTVACTSLTVSDEVEESQGVTYITMDFVEAATWLTGFHLVSNIVLSLTSILATSRAWFESEYNPTKAPYFLTDGVVDTTSSRIGLIRQEFGRALDADAPDTTAWNALQDLKDIESDTYKLRDTTIVTDAIEYGMRALAQYTNGADKFAAFRRIANGNALTSDKYNFAGSTENALYGYSRMLSGMYMAQATIEESFATIGDALEQYDVVMAVLDDEIAATLTNCDNQINVALSRFKADTQAALLTKAYKLPGLVTYGFGSAVHSLQAAYAIYDDATRFDDIELWNPGKWPWAVGPNVVAEAP